MNKTIAAMVLGALTASAWWWFGITEVRTDVTEAAVVLSTLATAVLVIWETVKVFKF